jgi:hypothetical protein
MSSGIFNAPVIEDLSQTAHDYYHGFLIVDGELLNQIEFSRKLPTLENNAIITFVAIQDTQDLYGGVEWAAVLNGSQIQSKLNQDNSLVAFSIELKFINKLTSITEKVMAFFYTIMGGNALRAKTKADDQVVFMLNPKRNCFMLNIAIDA